MDQSNRHHHQALPPFTLLMSVYAGNTLRQLERAVESGTIEQKLPPNQVVIVRDGPVSEDVQRYLDSLNATVAVWFAVEHLLMEPPTVTVVPLSENRGLAHALNVGLEHCQYEYVARADCDDVSLPDRFSTIIPQFAEAERHKASHASAEGEARHVDVVGSAIREFTGDEDRPGQIRLLPAEGEELESYARMQSPIHHPSVVFRKSAVLDAGGYPEDNGRFEDYMLWERLMLNHAGFLNVPEPLVLYRTDEEAYERRGGWDMFKEEVRLQWRFWRDGFTSFWQFLRNVTMRAVYRLTPTSIRKRAYHKLVDRHNVALNGPAHTEVPKGRHRVAAAPADMPAPATRPSDIPAIPDDATAALDEHGEPAGSAQADTAARTEPAAQGDTAARGPEHVLVPMTIPDDMPDATPDETPTEAMVAARKQPRPASIKPAHKRHQPAKHQARKPED